MNAPEKNIYDMKIRLEGDTLLFQNDRKIKGKTCTSRHKSLSKK